MWLRKPSEILWKSKTEKNEVENKWEELNTVDIHLSKMTIKVQDPNVGKLNYNHNTSKDFNVCHIVSIYRFIWSNIFLIFSR